MLKNQWCKSANAKGSHLHHGSKMRKSFIYAVPRKLGGVFPAEDIGDLGLGSLSAGETRDP